MKQKKLIVGLAAALVLLIAVVGVVIVATRPETQTGDKNISVTIIHKDKTEKELSIDTDAEFLGEAVYEEGVLTDEEYASGFYTVIDGEKADYDADKAWWKVTKDGEMTTVGMNEQPVADGDNFEITYTIG